MLRAIAGSLQPLRTAPIPQPTGEEGTQSQSYKEMNPATTAGA